MKEFDFKNINKDNIYIGDIMLISGLKKRVTDKLNISIGKSCDIVLAKKDAVLLKIRDNCFVDMDNIKDLKHCEYINYCLKNNIKDNIILGAGTLKPYVGQLYVNNLKSIKNVKENINILELKI